MRSGRVRVRAALRRLRAPDRAPGRWEAYLSGVEPALAAAPRVHRFAMPPTIGDPDLEPAPLAVGMGGHPPAAPAARPRRSLTTGTAAPVRILGGSLTEALAARGSERLVLVRAGDELAPLAAERLGQAAALAPDAAVLT